MSQSSYKPFPEANTIPPDQLQEVSDLINTKWDNLKVKSHQFVHFGKYIVLHNIASEIAEQVSVHLKDQSKTKSPKDIPPELKDEIEELKVKLDLTQKEINQLLKEVKKKEILQLELDKKLVHIRTLASKLSDHRFRQKVKQQFDKAYNKFFIALNTDLYELDQETKTELVINLEFMLGAINDTTDGLKK